MKTKDVCTYHKSLKEEKAAQANNAEQKILERVLALLIKAYLMLFQELGEAMPTVLEQNISLLYTKAQWSSQPSCYAENGTDSQGSARVELGGDSCEVNVLPPTKGQGAQAKKQPAGQFLKLAKVLPLTESAVQKVRRQAIQRPELAGKITLATV